MKKYIAIAMAALLCIQLLACGAEKEELQVYDDITPNEIEFDIPESIEEMEEETENEAEDETEGEVVGGQIQMNTPSFGIPKIEIETYGPVEGAKIQLDLPEMTVIDVETFDVEGFKMEASANIEAADLEKIEAMEVDEIAKIAELKTNLLLDLKFAFEKAGLTVQIDEATGEIALDAAVLFGTDESAVSEEGKALLKQFVEIYSFVLLHERYDGFISQIIIEGHTDTQGEYDYNMTLSQARADSVRDFCLSAESGIEDVQRSELESLLKAEGYSFDKPIYDENGEVDLAASRRVTFRFLINIA